MTALSTPRRTLIFAIAAAALALIAWLSLKDSTRAHTAAAAPAATEDQDTTALRVTLADVPVDESRDIRRKTASRWRVAYLDEVGASLQGSQAVLAELVRERECVADAQQFRDGLLMPFAIGSCAYEKARNRCSSFCLLYTSPSPRDRTRSRMPSSA